LGDVSLGVLKILVGVVLFAVLLAGATGVGLKAHKAYQIALDENRRLASELAAAKLRLETARKEFEVSAKGVKLEMERREMEMLTLVEETNDLVREAFAMIEEVRSETEEKLANCEEIAKRREELVDWHEKHNENAVKWREVREKQLDDQIDALIQRTKPMQPNY
jgi:hypothetical protein